MIVQVEVYCTSLDIKILTKYEYLVKISMSRLVDILAKYYQYTIIQVEILG